MAARPVTSAPDPASPGTNGRLRAWWNQVPFAAHLYPPDPARTKIPARATSLRCLEVFRTPWAALFRHSHFPGALSAQLLLSRYGRFVLLRLLGFPRPNYLRVARLIHRDLLQSFKCTPLRRQPVVSSRILINGQ